MKLEGKVTSDGLDLLTDCPVHGEKQPALRFIVDPDWVQIVCFKCHAEVAIKLVEQHQKENTKLR